LVQDFELYGAWGQPPSKPLVYSCRRNAVPGVLSDCLYTTCGSKSSYLVYELTLILSYALLEQVMLALWLK
jgi:hypothetical protein